ncbi:MAG: hypothetical protein WCO78_03845 [Candidatus Roizmanbacteria bacterium]
MGKKQFSLIPLIVALEDIFLKQGVSHRFVGGVSHAGLLEAGYRVENIDISNKTIAYAATGDLHFQKHSGTTRDIDIVTFYPDEVRMKAVKKDIHEYLRLHYPEVSVTVENAFYNKTPQRIKSFLTTYVWKGGVPHLYHAPLMIDIPEASLEPWHVVIGTEATYTTRHPLADWYSYAMRSSSGVKPKDREKRDLLGVMCNRIIELGQAVGIDYRSEAYFAHWATFVTLLADDLSPDLRLKRTLARLYWESPFWRVFTDNTHPVGKLLLKGIHILR